MYIKFFWVDVDILLENYLNIFHIKKYYAGNEFKIFFL